MSELHPSARRPQLVIVSHFRYGKPPQECSKLVGALDAARKRVPNGNAIATTAVIGLSRRAHPDDGALDRKIGTICRGY
jgi:hypothetical protein